MDESPAWEETKCDSEKEPEVVTKIESNVEHQGVDGDESVPEAIANNIDQTSVRQNYTPENLSRTDEPGDNMQIGRDDEQDDDDDDDEQDDDEKDDDAVVAEEDSNHSDREDDEEEENEDADDENDDNDDDVDEDYSSGEETDVEDNDIETWQVRKRRTSNPELPETVTVLNTEDGGKVYIVGTAHFSESSQDDVSITIDRVQPDVVMVELCKSRLNILQFDEKTLEEEAKSINFQKLRMSIKQSGFITGMMQILLLSMSAHLTKELGMAPGGEFRRAFHETQKVPGCRFHVGDRPIQITLRRAMAQLSVWQKCKLAWHLIMSKEPITKEDVEKCKQKDLLEEMLSEMTGEFPGLSHVFVEERDIYLAHSLEIAARPIPCLDSETGFIPAVVVGVVGMGHVPGITENWRKPKNIKEIIRVPEPSLSGKIFKWTFRATLASLVAYGCFRFVRWSGYSVYNALLLS